MIADIRFRSTAPWDNMKDLEVQEVYYDMVNDYFNNNGEDVCSFVTGNYMINSNKKIPSKGPDGTRIKTIILTGHSLGGGLAQVAHLFLKLSPLYGLVDACEEVDIRTVAFSAPMTMFLNKPDGATTDFLEKFIEPKMCNIVFNTDIVPRAYGNLRFINSFVNAFLNDESRGGEKANDLADSFVNVVVKTFKNNEEAVEQWNRLKVIVMLENSFTTKTLLQRLSSMWMADSRLMAPRPSGAKILSMTCSMDARTSRERKRLYSLCISSRY